MSGVNPMQFTKDKGLHRIFRIYARRYLTKINQQMVTKLTDLSTPNTSELLFKPRVYEDWVRDTIAQDYHTYVVICSIFYMGESHCEKGTDHADFQFHRDNEIKEYFKRFARKQIGTHLLVQPNGQLNSISFYRDQGLGVFVTDTAPVSAVLPAICIETRPGRAIPTQDLVLGLRFLHFEDNWKWNSTESRYINPEYRTRGLRYFHRDGESKKPLKCANAYDLLWTDLPKIENSKAPGIAYDEKPEYFAIYVCAGAKLLVLDQYNELPKMGQHNRTFIQQGGFVIVVGKLELDMFDTFTRDHIDLQTFIDIKSLKKGKQIKPNVPKCPVIFLGANESEYNSIAWKLSIDRDSNKILTATEQIGGQNNISRSRYCCLHVPIGGYIVAIEDWSDGITEFMSRHRYEQLFKAVTHLFNDKEDGVRFYPKFQAPNDDMLKKILCVETDRYITCADALTKSLPKEFNFYAPVETPDLSKHNTLIPWAPPAYPPISHTTNPNSTVPLSQQTDFANWRGGNAKQALLYLPQHSLFGHDFKEVYAHYRRDKALQTTDDKLYTANEAHVFKLEDREHTCAFEEFVWEKKHLGYQTNPRNRDLLTNTDSYRLGVDGYCYYKTETKFAKYKTSYYELVGGSARSR